jgi:two-component system, OmpR family, sensor histidine kinase MprB
MTFRARIAIASAAAVALTIVLASIIVFFVVRSQLRAPIDDALEVRAARISASEGITPDAFKSLGGQAFFLLGPGFESGTTQLVTARGEVFRPHPEFKLPVDAATVAVARGEASSFYRDAHVAGSHVRVLTFRYPFDEGLAIQIIRPLTEVDQSLRRIGLFLLLIAGAGIAVAGGLGFVVARAALSPVKRLTETAETVTATGDLSQRIEVGGKGELSRLAASFNSMLAALEDSTRAQRQLVADASHELRTPLTSLRTNIEVLASDRALPPQDRTRLLSDVVEQLGEMTTLISELIELARAEQHASEPEDVRLDLVAAQALERARRNRPGIVFTADLAETVVHGGSAAIERAIGNLLDNAAKWSPDGGEVHLQVRDGEVTVIDHGPGIDDEDLPYVFDRFYRAKSARGLPGSGLGLAIVRRVADAHGGDVVAERAEGGGTRLILRLNGSSPAPTTDHPSVLATS